MTKKSKPRTKFTLTIGNDPSVWRYNSLAEAMTAGTDILAQLIHSVQTPDQAKETPIEKT